MDIAFPITSDNGELETVNEGSVLAQQRVYTQIVTIKGERPYRPQFGVRQTLFMNPPDYPDTVEGVLIQMDYSIETGNLTYSVEVD